MSKVQEKVWAYISQDDNLTPKQRDVVLAQGNLGVIACPGSGKTRTVGTRMAYRIANWKSRRSGIATLSFTNVAALEIEKQIHDVGLTGGVTHPHFLGTINSFADHNIFLPYGHLVMSDKPLVRRPSLVLEHNEDWLSRRFKLKEHLANYRIVDFHYETDGTVMWRKPRNSWMPPPNRMHGDGVDEMKALFARAGYATHTDAMYWSLKVLEEFPEISEVLAARYTEIVVDEFQDTSKVQINILRKLVATKNCTVCFVGDPDQSIYEFHRADPLALLRIKDSGKWPVYELTENWRSSQKICNVTYRFSSRSKPDRARGSYKDGDAEPIVFPYPDRELAILPHLFAGILNDLSIPEEKATIVTLTNRTVARLHGTGAAKKWPRVSTHSRRLILAANHMEGERIAEAMRIVESILLELRTEHCDYGWQREHLGDISYREWIRNCFAYLEDLPPTTEGLNDWLVAAKAATVSFLSDRGWAFDSRRMGAMFKRIATDKDARASSFLETKENEYGFSVRTIHDVKGETHLATMLVGRPVLKSGGKSDVSDWFVRDSERNFPEESMRTAYVAMTRPRCLLVVAVPTSAWPEAYARLKGFNIMRIDGDRLVAMNAS